MGNASSLGEGGEEEENEGDDVQDLMRQSPPQSFKRTAQSPLLFTPQNPTVPLRRPDELLPMGNTRVHNFPQYDDIIYEQGIPTMITWSYGGKEVAVEGSWDNWNTKKVLQKSGKDFTIMKVLPSGVYRYRFSVDGESRYSPDMPLEHDEFGNAFNILDLQDSVPDEIGSVAGFEPPLSPESTYNNWPLDSEDLAKEPPSVPPQLGCTLLNSTFSDENSMLSRPQHVVLNHLFIHKGRIGESAIALSATHRFRAKYVTMVFYKSL
ncbi:SNF1-related protein kinase regulatory subunit beta-2-like [Phalaenopsis equestris]|uniref:SNF1-related protein kinase regulatory subunit beta-2-like n=1 Tax=Phalaenopsis equestris TaxID=78828 RepID=UPI0009E48656|nr:SNF1-related protein kinase regulatory subunit beta-2-like [Phalaenopsis equestris]XP_020572921.1 SNF1-related protein kinase regulatory subunit beta-2-like [Phalaenopsis equestris]XP_020572922.1 SNF1-related protein kinase regulatory subunit beta-2-like [Phalaenopsis equestris]XP_020572924.1 SNF1-related protein kinase regulatory subunit beta-2-like [Phalaenopsis equestris]XP_020572925.1 SNF1-related protein kinase regulatory subunit beta-2-like [Phalaenopsis equestris]XP_020572927.1 SNF1-